MLCAQIPDLAIQTDPSPAEESLVGIDTWFWVEGCARWRRLRQASVPGINVVATATPGAVRIDFGDGTIAECTGAGVEYTAGGTSDCTHSTRWRNVHDHRHGAVDGHYTVNGQGPFTISTAVPRTDTFVLPSTRRRPSTRGTARSDP